MKCAIIGSGYWGKNHVKEYVNLKTPLIVCDLNIETLKKIKEQFPSIEITSSLEEILNNNEINAVSICTPNNTHFEIAKKCIEKNKHVLLEKPMALNYKDALKLVKIAKEKKVILMVGHVFRFNNAIRKAKELMQKNELGKIYLVKLSWTNLDPVYPDRDIVTDLGLHPIDIVNFLFDKNPENIKCIGRGFRRKEEETMNVFGEIDNIFVSLEFSWIMPPKKRSITIIGDKKTIVIDALSQELSLIYNSSLKEEKIKVIPSNALQAELQEFLKCVEEKTPPISSGEKGAEIIKLLEEVNQLLLKNKFK